MEFFWAAPPFSRFDVIFGNILLSLTSEQDNYGIDSWNVHTCLYAHTRPILGRFLAWGIAKNTTSIMEIILKLSAQRAADRHYA
jgi:hypothetical protein